MVTPEHPAPKQLVILSGKGGTGKTSLCAALVDLASQSLHQSVFADADVDASNLALVTDAVPIETHSFSSSSVAEINQDRCIRCGKCFDVCRFNAVREPGPTQAEYGIDPLLCEGCAACQYICPEEAIQMVIQQDGEWYHSRTPYGHQFHAELFPAAENSGKLVTLVKQNAKLYAEDHHLPLILVDGPPGIGCPVISASAGADLVLIVTEPGLSGVHDLERITETLKYFKIPAVVVINKADIYPKSTQEIHARSTAFGYSVVGEIPFDATVPQAMTSAQPITLYASESPAARAIRQIWETIEGLLFSEEANA
jgi:MinD superfamily P-loop ATPase